MKIQIYVEASVMTDKVAMDACRILKTPIRAHHAATFDLSFNLSDNNPADLLAKLQLLEIFVKSQECPKMSMTLAQWKLLKRLRRNVEDYLDIMEDMRVLK